MKKKNFYKICARCVMDTSAPDITFDADGICNYCKAHEAKFSATPYAQGNGEESIKKIVARIKSSSSGEYDSIVGLSGGVDSSYVAWQAVKLGLHPLAVHFDNGWNSELAVKNIENIVSSLNLDLVTFVIDWEEFRDIQRSFFKAHVVDIEMVTDHAIFAALYKIARQHKIRYILSGTNAATESIMPKSWQHFKYDLLNLKSIHKKFGALPIKKYPTMGVFEMAWHHYVGSVKTISPLNYTAYRKDAAMRTLEKEVGWQYYGGKHYESVFTRFYQAYILPCKFGIDKRRIHLSDLIMNQEISRNNALKELETPPYVSLLIERDRDYVCKKLGFSQDEFDAYMNEPGVDHYAFPSYAKLATKLVSFHKRWLRT